MTALRGRPELVFVPPRFDIYRSVSRQIDGIFRDCTSLIQPLSLDKAYLDITGNLRGLPAAWLTAKQIRARILEETSLTASAGISYNKFIAKPTTSKNHCGLWTVRIVLTAPSYRRPRTAGRR